MRFRFYHFFPAYLALAIPLFAEGARLPLSRTAPILYTDKLAGKLTKLESVKGELPKDMGAKAGGVVLLTNSCEPSGFLNPPKLRDPLTC
jgi:hypothetical protein